MKFLKIGLCKREDDFLCTELPFLSHAIAVLVGGPWLTPYLGGPKSLGGPNLVGGTSDPSTYHVLTMWRCGDMDISSFSAISLAKNG